MLPPPPPPPPPPMTRKGPRELRHAAAAVVVVPLRARDVVGVLLKTRQRIHNRFSLFDDSYKFLTCPWTNELLY